MPYIRNTMRDVESKIGKQVVSIVVVHVVLNFIDNWRNRNEVTVRELTIKGRIDFKPA